MNRIILTLCLGLGLAACSKDAEEPPVKAATQATAEATTKNTPPPAEDATEFPVAADFEEEVRAEITADNYAAELEKLEAELPDEN